MDIWQEWRQHRFVRAVLTLVGATVAAQLLVVAITPVLTRLYTPEMFGVMALFLAIATTVLTVSSGRYELAIVLPSEASNGLAMWQLAQCINALAAIFMLAITLISWPLVRHFNANPQLIAVLWLMPLYVLMAGIFRANHYFALRQQSYRQVGHTKMVQTLVGAGGQVVLAGSTGGALGLIAGQTLGQGAGAWWLGRTMKLRWRDYRSCWPLSPNARDLARQYARFPRYDVPASLVDVLSVQLPNLSLLGYFGPTVAGWYVLAERIVMLPVSLVGQAVGQVLLGFSREAQSGTGLYRLGLRAVVFLSALAIFPALILGLFGEPLFAWVFGNEWQYAGMYASWLIAGAVVQLVYAPVSMLLMATDGQKLNLGIHSAMLVGKVIALIFGVALQKPNLAVQGFALVSAVGYGVAILLVLRHLHAHEEKVSVS